MAHQHTGTMLCRAQPKTRTGEAAPGSSLAPDAAAPATQQLRPGGARTPAHREPLAACARRGAMHAAGEPGRQCMAPVPCCSHCGGRSAAGRTCR